MKRRKSASPIWKTASALERLLSEKGILPPLPEEPAISPTRTETIVTRPRCGKKQRGGWNACYSCGLPFQYESE